MNTLWRVAEVQVKYRGKLSITNRPIIKGSQSAEEVFRANWSDNMALIEEFNVLFLNRANYVKGILRLSRGGITGTVADARILFAAALKGLATGIIVAHNHPSGCLKPSSQDVDLTRKLKHAGQLLDITLLDHIILVPNSGFYSFADEGML
ncbi:MAG: JAB domain-containing protein [Saprospiraceae bacterium]|nr:JAB domain-containing protein [Saprospiraceae bacterium]MBK8298686.1 JAB domain-containing protein [Saprospiraceae bacterium]